MIANSTSSVYAPSYIILDPAGFLKSLTWMSRHMNTQIIAGARLAVAAMHKSRWLYAYAAIIPSRSGDPIAYWI